MDIMFDCIMFTYLYLEWLWEDSEYSFSFVNIFFQNPYSLSREYIITPLFWAKLICPKELTSSYMSSLLKYWMRDCSDFPFFSFSCILLQRNNETVMPYVNGTLTYNNIWWHYKSAQYCFMTLNDKLYMTT